MRGFSTTDASSWTGSKARCAAPASKRRFCGEPCLFDIVFTGQPIVDYWSCENGDKTKAARFNEVLRKRGVIKGTSKFYVSVAHTQEDIDQTIGAFEAAAAEIAEH